MVRSKIPWKTKEMNENEEIQVEINGMDEVGAENYSVKLP